MKKQMLSLLTVALLAGASSGVQIHPKAGTTSAAFLKLGIGSRATAMGSSFAGLADDVTALYWNPAGLAWLSDRELHFTHNEVFENIRHDFAGYAFPGWGGVAGLAVYGLYTPQDIERRSGLDEADPYEPISPVEGYFMAYDMAVQGSYSRKLDRRTSFGASFKVLRQEIDGISGYGAAADLGLMRKFESRPLSLGFVVQHAGTPVKLVNQAYDLPLNIKLGAAYRWNDRLTTTFDLNQPNDNYLFVSAGAEYSLVKFMSLRAGYRYRWYGLELGDMSGLSAGVGFVFPAYDSRIKFDYAFIPYGVLGNSHRISIGVEFGQPGSPKEEKPKTREIKAAAPAQPAPLIMPKKPAQAAGDLDGYSVFRATATAKLKLAGSKRSVSEITVACEGSDIYRITGVTGAQVNGGFSFAVGEKGGAGGPGAYKRFAFQSVPAVPVAKARIWMRLPAGMKNPSLLAKDGRVIPLVKTGGDQAYDYFSADIGRLQEFSVRHE